LRIAASARSVSDLGERGELWLRNLVRPHFLFTVAAVYMPQSTLGWRSLYPHRQSHRCNKRLRRLQKILRKHVYYFVNVYYLNKHHM